MNLEKKIKLSETRTIQAVFPNTTNYYDILFGGTAMHLMDEVAFITTTHFTRKMCVTVSSDRIDFKKAIPAWIIIELIGSVSKTGNTGLDVKVYIYIEQMYSDIREKAITGNFTLVALDENKKRSRILN